MGKTKFMIQIRNLIFKQIESFASVACLLDVNKVSIPATNNVAILLRVFEVTAFKRIDLTLQVCQVLLATKHNIDSQY
jgi:hypothetical protein